MVSLSSQIIYKLGLQAASLGRRGKRRVKVLDCLQDCRNHYFLIWRTLCHFHQVDVVLLDQLPVGFVGETQLYFSRVFGWTSKLSLHKTG